MRDAMTEGEFSKHLDAMTAYGSERKTLILRCTCPTPEGCVCDQSDDENGETMTCPACSEMRHTEADCMVYVLSSWNQEAR